MNQEDGFKILKVFSESDQEDIDVIVSVSDFDALCKIPWYIANGYARNVAHGSMHQYIWSELRGLHIPPGMTIDHVNRERCDNRIQNLRLATYAQQALNRSKRPGASSLYFGVRAVNGKYIAGCTRNAQSFYLGLYETEIEAAEIYDRWTVHHPDFHEGFLVLNFPDKENEWKTFPPPPVKRRNVGEFHGVQKRGSKWRAKTKGFSKIFEDPLEAALARDDAVVRAGINTTLNFPERYPDFGKKLKLAIIRQENDAVVARIERTGIDIVLDMDEYDKYKFCTICVGSTGYASVILQKKYYVLSRIIAGAVGTQKVIYKNDNKLDLRRVNLRVVTDAEVNQHNKKRLNTSSGTISVYKKRDRWMCDLKLPFLRQQEYFDTKEDAARWRDLQLMHYYPTGCNRMIFNWTPDDILYWSQRLNICFKQ